MKKISFTFLLCLSLAACYAQNYTWTNMPNFGQGFYAPCSFTIDSNIYVLCGWTNTTWSGYPVPLSHQVWQFNTYTHVWTQKNDFPGTPVYGGRGFAIGNYGYLVNGWDSTGSSEAPNVLWQYNSQNDTWALKAPFPGSIRYTCSTFALNNLGYVACGFGSSTYYSDLYAYDPSTDSWSQKTSFPGGGRQDMAFVTIGDIEYMGMGSTSNGVGGYFLESDWYKYDGNSDTWTMLGVFPGDAVVAPFSFGINGEGYIVDGLNQNAVNYSESYFPSNKVWKYTPGSDNWSLWGVLPDSNVFGGAFGSGSDGAGYIGFGARNYQNYPLTNNFYRFGPANGNYSCSSEITTVQISNAVYNFQANGSFSPTGKVNWNFGDGKSGDGSSVTHNFTTAGTYTVTVTVTDTAYSCSDSTTTSVSVSNINNCSVVVNSTSFGSTFTFSTSVVNGAGPYKYQWSTSSDSTFSSVSPDPVVTLPVNIPANYCVTVMDTTGCVATACKAVIDSQTYATPCQIYLVVYPDSAVPGAYYGIIYTLGNATLSYYWSFGDGDTSTLELPSYTYPYSAYWNICLTVTDGPGCSFTFCDSSFYAFKYGGGPMSQFSVRGVQQVTLPNSITNTSLNTGIDIFPNPAENIITINTSGHKVDHATIYDVNGQQVINIAAPAQNNVDVSKLTDGIYFMEVKSAGTSVRVKFIKIN